MNKKIRMEGSVEPKDELALFCSRILALIVDKRYSDARSSINDGYKSFPVSDEHRFMALEAVLYERLGEIDNSIQLLQRATQDKPTWLPHLYQLSVLLMDVKRWDEADGVLRDLVALSVTQNETYFLCEGRFRRAICLKELGRLTEFQLAKAEIPLGTRIFIGNRSYQIDDIT